MVGLRNPPSFPGDWAHSSLSVRITRSEYRRDAFWAQPLGRIHANITGGLNTHGPWNELPVACMVNFGGAIGHKPRLRRCLGASARACQSVDIRLCILVSVSYLGTLLIYALIYSLIYSLNYEAISVQIYSVVREEVTCNYDEAFTGIENVIMRSLGHNRQSTSVY